MSFVTSIRDYVETLNTIASSQDLTLTSFVSETAFYVLKTLQAGLVYLVSFQWIRDFTLLPIVLPQQHSSVFKETFFLETPSQVFFDFLEIPSLNQNQFLLGFFNSFFLSLPVSVVYIVAIRRLLIQGIPAAVYSIGGYLSGQILFLACTLFGIRQILIPWLTLEPLNYILGLILIFRVIYSMTRETLKELKGWFLQEYKAFFLISFLLAWCEQTSVFQYLGNLTATSTVTVLETFSSSSAISSFWSHFLYLSGILIGCIFFNCLWGFFLLQLKNWFILYTPVFLTSFIQFVNKTSFVLTLAFSLTGIPFYGFDYLVTGPLGFVSQDFLFNNTVFDQRNEKLQAVDPRLSDMETNFQYIHIDVAPFDRGEYLLANAGTPALSFEELNYRGEFDWTGRSNYQGIADARSSFFSLSKLLKKQKSTPLESSKQINSSKILQQNNLLSDKEKNFDPSDFETESVSADRFLEHYDLPEGTDDSTFFTAYRNLYNTSFAEDYLRMEPAFEKNIEQKIKNKYYSNPVYKTLLKIDIDLFLKRQPSNFQISAEQENDLYTKRRMLESYYDSLRDYSQLPYSETFETFFDGTKSFSNKVYNQQFKGTLRSIRRLFSLTVNNENADESNKLLSQNERVLKFDQPLYNFSENETFSSYHEELDNQTSVTQARISGATDFNKNNFFDSNFLVKPLYAGWDEQSRKFVITNKLLTKRFAGYQVSVEPQISKKFLQNSGKYGRKIKFTTWPLSKYQIEQQKIPSVTLYETLNPETRLMFETSGAELDTLPSNFERYKANQGKKGEVPQIQEPFVTLAPKRGGFIWPGNVKFTFPFFSN